MPTIAIENGKRIEELIDINRLNDDSYFVVSDAALTRKITLLNLRNAFNGDSATSNLGNVYYSVEKRTCRTDIRQEKFLVRRSRH